MAAQPLMGLVHSLAHSLVLGDGAVQAVYRRG